MWIRGWTPGLPKFRSVRSVAFFSVVLLTSVVRAQNPAPASQDSVRSMHSLRVLCFNIHHGEGSDGVVDLGRQADVIRRAKPDLVALQEVDDRTQRTNRTDQTAELAGLTGMHGRFVHQLDYEGGRYGQAILSRFPLSDVTVHWLPGTPDRERRIAGSVSVTIHNQPITFVTTHLHHQNEQFRQDQTRRLNELFPQEEDGNLTILAGDLNAVPDSIPLRILQQTWKSATENQIDFLTFPASSPERQLDYVLFHPADRLKIISAEVLPEPVASDHRPLIIEFALDGPAASR